MKTEAPGCTHITGFAGTFECPNSSSDIRHMLPTLNQHVKVPMAFNIQYTNPWVGPRCSSHKLCNKYGFPHSVTSLPVLGGNLEVLEPEYGSPQVLREKHVMNVSFSALLLFRFAKVLPQADSLLPCL
jgi:hypothetical protein